MEFWYESFHKLGTCRPPSFGGMTRIPWTAVSRYCRDYDIHGEDRDDLEYVLQKMDDEYIKYVNEKSEQERKSKSAAPRRLGSKPKRR